MKKIRKIYNKVLFVFIIIMIVSVANVFMGVCFTKLEKVSINTDKLTEGSSIRLLQISDVHNKKSLNSNRQLIRLTQEARPDLVVITGDLIDDNTRDLENVYKLVEGISAICPKIYFVTGNHEWRGGIAEDLMMGLSKRGVKILDNKNEFVKVRDLSLNLCGVSDWTSGQLDLSKALKGADSGIYTVMLAHDPWIINDYKDLVPDLTLSGHTHGGQVRFPWVGAIVAPGQKLFPDLDKGFYNLENDKFLYIDSGVGISSFPIRFLNRSQITLITIE
ncbi:MAG: putative metallophosphoesterase [Clostridia bacterium]|jgi:predicted MPP superfamily phosphohydrolase|nr:putative metallophosphoesterase [Clostridia bacterium]